MLASYCAGSKIASLFSPAEQVVNLDLAIPSVMRITSFEALALSHPVQNIVRINSINNVDKAYNIRSLKKTICYR